MLPFENLSVSGNDAFFTVGVQEEISAALERVAALKVIGSKSTQDYVPKDHDVPKIARELGVTYVLAGSVWRDAGQLRVTARLIDSARTEPVWTSTYERPLPELFAVRREIVSAVAGRMNVRLSEAEMADLARVPTQNMEAYDFLLRARQTRRSAATPAGMRKLVAERIAYGEQAVARDPNFALAWHDLARAHAGWYSIRAGATPEEVAVDHRALAEKALEAARRLDPGSADLDVTEAAYHVRVTHDMARAGVAADRALKRLPNDVAAAEMAGRVAVTEGRWVDALRSYERGRALAPNRIALRLDLAETYRLLRRYSDFDAVIGEMMAICKCSGNLSLDRAKGPLDSHGDLVPMRTAVAALANAGTLDPDDRDWTSIVFALYERNADALDGALDQSARERFDMAGAPTPKAWFRAFAARFRGDAEGVQRSLTEARTDVESSLASEPGNARALGLLALIDAGLGRTDDAVNEARRACDLTAKSAPDRPIAASDLAAVYAWTGQTDMAFATLQRLVSQ
ncbi:MAG TPA: hypothetical protein VF911_19105, partial [Thermoanaerobaculia bacterium]